ncbi:MAG: hypothetical protein AABX14_01655 [Candidatus Aenigmatarchaeota archaeon]
MDKQIVVLIVLIGIVGVVSVASISSTLSLLFMQDSPQTEQQPMQRMSGMSLTVFDTKMAEQMMDQNGDGMCDICGMPVAMCIGSGQIQCNMGPDPKIGVLGSQHIHADRKIYINGKVLDDTALESLAMDMSKMDSSITSSFIHLDKGAPSPEKTGDIIHMHATGVPLWIFFKSVGMDFNKDCIKLPDGRKFCNDDKKTLKFYVNDKPNSEWENYVFKDLDNILISYGDEADLMKQLDSITDFAKNH